MKRWFTCVNIPFQATPSFFARDNGMLCRELLAMGYESRIVMPLPPFSPAEKEPPDVLRATPQELRSAAWWRALRLDGVVMVGWARIRDMPVIRAITGAGIPLAEILDSSGNAYPLFDQWETWKTAWRAERESGLGPAARAARVALGALTRAVRMLPSQLWRVGGHLRHIPLVCVQTLPALERYQRLCRWLGGRHHGVHLMLTGCQIPSSLTYDPAVPKEKRLIAIGRWEDWRQKRPGMLMAASEGIARRHADLHIDIFGTATPALERWHAGLEPTLQARMHLHGNQSFDVLTSAKQRAQIFFCPSAFESGPISLFECLACGATSVAYSSLELSGHAWAAAEGYGTSARADTPAAYIDALDRELLQWERGGRDPQKISAFWQERSHASHILRRIIAELEPFRAHPGAPRPALDSVDTP